jgi:type I restriction enzyme R subunit
VYRQFLELRPEWDGKIKVVMTADNKDPEDRHAITGNKVYKKDRQRNSRMMIR